MSELLECKICGRFFKHLGVHVWLKHGITAREYKQSLGLDVGLPLITTDVSIKLSQSAYRNGMDKKLKTLGTQTRFIKGSGWKGNYKRSKQTMEQLKETAKIMQDSIRLPGPKRDHWIKAQSLYRTGKQHAEETKRKLSEAAFKRWAHWKEAGIMGNRKGKPHV